MSEFTVEKSLGKFTLQVIAFTLLVAVGFIAYYWTAVVFWYLWEWFVIPLRPEWVLPNIWHIVGLLTTARFVTNQQDFTRKTKPEEIPRAISFWFFYPLLVLSVAYIVKSWFM